MGAGGFAVAGYCPGATVALLAAPAPPGLAPPGAGALIVGVGPTVGTELGVGAPVLAPLDGAVLWFCWTPWLVGLWVGVGVVEVLGVVDGVTVVLWPPPRVVPV